jgi:hypothetical protein
MLKDPKPFFVEALSAMEIELSMVKRRRTPENLKT